jgi:hypothetical protein
MDQEAHGVSQCADPDRGSKLTEDLGVHGDNIKASAYPFVKGPDSALGE